LIAGDAAGGGQPAKAADAEEPPTIDIEVPTDVRLIDEVVQRIGREVRRLDLPESYCSLNVPVALSEALANAMLRGNSDDPTKTVRLRVTATPGEVTFEVSDEGTGFDIDQSMRDPTTAENRQLEDGRGLFLMRRLMDRVDRFTEGGHPARNVVRLTLIRPQGHIRERHSELDAILNAFFEATGCPAFVWGVPPTSDSADMLRLLGGVPRDITPTPPPRTPPTATEPVTLGTASRKGRVICGRVGSDRNMLVLGPAPGGGLPVSRLFRFLSPVLTEVLEAAREVEHAATELAERYEEINLLYTIGEILGRTVHLEEAADRILREISETVGASRASILVHDRVTDTLQAVAVNGFSETVSVVHCDIGLLERGREVRRLGALPP